MYQRVGVRDVSLLVLNIKPLNPHEIILFYFTVNLMQVFYKLTLCILKIIFSCHARDVRGSSR
jgi:hypothetical protein